VVFLAVEKLAQYWLQTVLPQDKPKNAREMSLVEVGPRFCLNPVKIFAGSFQGVTLYENPAYVSPNTVGRRDVWISLDVLVVAVFRFGELLGVPFVILLRPHC
jgi:hypothetical protein